MILAFIISLLVGLCLTPILLFLINRLKAGQSILSYVTQHRDKEGVPTMGGLIFLLSATVGYFLCCSGQGTLSTVAYAAFIAYGLIGLLDDGIKVVLKRNLGLKAYQKVISQAVVAALLTYYCFANEYVGSHVYLPFLKRNVDFGWWYLPFCFSLFIATTNAVNLTDGLDGLAGNVSCVYLTVVGVFIALYKHGFEESGSVLWAMEAGDLLVLCAAVVGGVAAFLWSNTNRARVFMGDTGSLALGGICCILPVMIKNPFLIAFVGITFVVSVISVIVQVISFKTRKKRVFLMAPFHHHLEMKGYKEPAIVAFYTITTVLFGALAILLF